MKLSAAKIQSIETILEYTFQDKTYLERAMTRRAYALEQKQHGYTCEDQEVQCTWGDAILKSILVELLIEQDYNSRASITIRKQQLEQREYLGNMLQAIAISEHLLLGEGEAKQEVGKQASVRGETLEAVIAAIRQDGGYEVAKQVIAGWFLPLMEQAA